MKKTLTATEKSCQDMLKAASLMPEQKAIDHVTKQAALIFDDNHNSLSVVELELSAAQIEFDRISERLKKLRRERSQYSEAPNGIHPEKEEQDDEQEKS